MAELIHLRWCDGQHYTTYDALDNPEGEVNMDIEKYVERLDLDRRESEARVAAQTANLENRLREDRQQMEQRIEARMMESRRLSEEREARLDKRITETMSRMDKAVDGINESKRWIIGLCVATALAMAGIAVAVLIGVAQII